MAAPVTHSPVERALGQGIGRICTWSVRHRGLVIVLTLLATGLFGFGLSKIYVRSADYDLMPDGHPSNAANQHALAEVPGFRSIETVWMEHRDPHGNITSPDAIRAAEELEDYVRSRVLDDEGRPVLTYTYSLAYLVKLVNYTLSGVPNPACNLNPLPVPMPPEPVPPVPPVPQPVPPEGCVLVPPSESAFAMPASDGDIQRNYDVIAQANFGAIEGVVDERFHGTLVVFMYDFNLTQRGPEAVLPASERFLHVVEHFRDADCDRMQVRLGPGNDTPSLVNCPHIYVLGEAINAHMTELANKDLLTWGPVVFVATLVVLLIAFWFDWAATGIAALAFVFGLVWTYGFMGYLSIPLTFFGLLIVPITLGVGKEYAIYVTNQYLEYHAEGHAPEAAFGLVGRRAGAALLIASVTSIVGVATMALANFFIMRDLAILTCFAFAALFLISITFIPAMHSLRGRRAPRPFRPVRSLAVMAVWLRRHRVLVTVATVAITIGAAVEATHIEEYFGISGGFKKGDYLETSYRYYNEVLGGSGTELVVIETTPKGVADPATIDYLRALDASFKADDRTIPKDSNVNSLIIALDTYYALKDGLFNPKALSLTAGQSPIPRDRDQVYNDINAAFDSPVWASLMALFTGRTGNIVVTHVFYHITAETYDALRADWDSLNCDIGRADQASTPCSKQAPKPPPTVTAINLVGTQDTFYLYVTYGQPWLEYVGYMASFLTLAVAILVLGRARDFLALVPGAGAFGTWFAGLYGHDQALLWLAGTAGAATLLVLWALRARDVAAIMVPMLLASVWWAGLLPLFGIKASLTLMLPTVFLISVGSDYAIQYVWNYRQIGDMGRVYASTGKANVFVVAATVLAFLLFVPMKLVLSSQGALAAALAILVIFVVTTVLVPLFYPAGRLDPPVRFFSGRTAPLPPARPEEERPTTAAPARAIKSRRITSKGPGGRR